METLKYLKEVVNSLVHDFNYSSIINELIEIEQESFDEAYMDGDFASADEFADIVAALKIANEIIARHNR